MKRTFKTFTVTSGGTPQPLVGTATGAAIIAGSAPQSVLVTDSSMFYVGDPVYVGVGSAAERVYITAIADGTHISAIFTLNHNSGVTVALDVPFNSIFVQSVDGNAGMLYVFYVDRQFAVSGRVAPAITGFVKGIAKLANVIAGQQPTEFSSGQLFGANPDSLAYYWIDGTTSDGYLPSIDQT